VVGRELTKKFEEFRRGSVSEVIDYFEENQSKVKGEFVVLF
jgi:16S rRNA (cytidine1402-2'-O)-methyltransferase